MWRRLSGFFPTDCLFSPSRARHHHKSSVVIDFSNENKYKPEKQNRKSPPKK
eukprot:m.214393 g.214393  ORF g.214393 m.214393 type:complete len:52 (+) comp33176_c1_seq1:430-585(+)